jgi:ribose/xylose/arabinose/galactoside ABC-type transport system permease subunit
VIAVVFALIAGFIMWQTSYGVHTKAIGSNREGALRSGIAVRRHLVSIYLISGALAGVGGVIRAPAKSCVGCCDLRRWCATRRGMRAAARAWSSR